MPTISAKDQALTFTDSLRHEWLEANGLGGWASSTISGTNTRRYHGLLVAAESTSRRCVLLSHVAETLVVGKDRVPLFDDEFAGTSGPVLHPGGHQFLERFERDLAVHFYFRIGAFLIQKSVLALHGENATMLRYELCEGTSAALLELRPFLAGRDIHALTHQNPEIDTFATFEHGILKCNLYSGIPGLEVRIEQGRFVAQPDWWNNFWYRAEHERGFDATEDLFTPGSLHVALFPNSPVYVHCRATSASPDSGEVEPVHPARTSRRKTETRLLEPLWQQEIERRAALVRGEGISDEYASLLLAADQFIVRTNPRHASILAGFPWFTDWGRDAMISIPGLCLCTGRFDDARDILLLFKEHMNNGLLPNRFPDGSGPPEYNSVDASLWAFEVVWQFSREPSSRDVIQQQFLPMLTEIAEAFIRGTDFHIKVDNDGLLRAGDESTQLTWMDARVDGRPVTPRHGKAVEINALWINALLVLAGLYGAEGNKELAERYQVDAQAAAQIFMRKFWLEKAGYLADCVWFDRGSGKWRTDDTLRPNQLLALSLSMPGFDPRARHRAEPIAPFEVVPVAHARQVIARVRSELFVGIGLRSLAPSSSGYCQRYEGGPATRDYAYHQGTVWPWLLGPYMRAVARYGTPAELKHDGDRALSMLRTHLHEAGVGSVSEICDAQEPHTARGCPFQAWSVGAAIECFHLLGAAP